MQKGLQKTWIVASLLGLTACALPPSKTLLPHSPGIMGTDHDFLRIGKCLVLAVDRKIRVYSK